MSFALYLAQNGVLRREDVESIQREADQSEKGIDGVLVRLGIAPDRVLTLKSQYYGLPERSLLNKKIPVEVLKYIPQESARYYGVAPLGIMDGALEIGIVDPDRTEAGDAAQFISSKLGMPYRLFVIIESDFEEVLRQYQNLSGEVSKALSELTEGGRDEENVGEGITIKKGKRDDSGDAPQTHVNAEEENKIVEDAPVTKIVAVILKHAVEGNASDVHIEHTGEKIRVRFRVDGVMYTSLILPLNIHSAIVARIKILSQLRLDEKRKPQDGSFSAVMDNKKIDFRVSTFPASYGEKVVLRILDPSRGVKTLDDMGMSPDKVALIREAIKIPYGLILVTGPTGSGKSTTLYAMLNELDREKKNIVSLEDPVEYNIAGVSQSQVRPEIGYTFANGLRSILRQDPDIIMVGEIRDKETAQLAIQASLTGHLVFSTLHTNSSAGVIPRLIDMGVDPYLIAPTLTLAIGQRLLRTLCVDSKRPTPVSESMRLMIDRQFADLPEEVRKSLPIPNEIFEAAPSATCPSGTKGRIGVYEFLQMDKDIEHVILTNPVEAAVYEAARKKGMMMMKDDAFLKAFAGVIPFEEVNNIL
jgi:type IV pilus assembly protein PilB